MKYWKGKTGTAKQDQCGTMDDDGYVPDSVECSKEEYDAWVGAQPAPMVITEMTHLVAWAKTKGYVPKQVTT